MLVVEEWRWRVWGLRWISLRRVGTSRLSGVVGVVRSVSLRWNIRIEVLRECCVELDVS